MGESTNPATMGGARIVDKADRLATPSIPRTAADCDRAALRFDLISRDAAIFGHGGKRVLTRRERGDPLCNVARAAIARGMDPASPAAVFLGERPALIVRSSLASLARLDMLEDSRGLVRWWPYGGPAP